MGDEGTVLAEVIITSWAVLWIRIRKIHMFLGLPDPNPDSSIIQQNSEKNIDSFSLWLFIF